MWIGNPAVGHGEDKKRQVVFEITISDFDLRQGVRSPVGLWKPDGKRTLDGRSCRLLKEG